MTYKCRPGIVRVKICGEYLLTPTRAASEACPKVLRLSIMKAALWEELEKGHDGSVVVRAFHALSRKPEEEIRKKVDQALTELYEGGFIIRADEN